MKTKKLLLILFSAFALTSCDLNKVSSLSPQSSSSDSSSSSSESSAHEHTYSDEWKSDKDNHWHEATCGHNEISEKGPHRYEDTVTPSTYEGGGYTTHTCKDCGYSYKDSETPALEHKYATTWMYDEETHWHACIDEGYENLRKDEAKHSYSSVVTSPTCTEGGYTTYVCECGASYTSDEKEKLGHSFSSEWAYDDTGHWHKSTCGHDVISDKESHTLSPTTTPPTYEKEGYTIYTCECGYYSEKTDFVSKREHTFSTSWAYDDTSHWHACIDEGYENLRKDEAKHSYSSVVTSPTCTEGGYTTYVCECGASYTSDTKEKLGHSYSEEWERDENTHWHEATCGHEVRGSEGPHDYKEEVVSPTYERGGYTTYTCKTCGRTYQGNETPALTHTYSTEWKSDKKSHWHECLDKGFESLKGEEAEHTFGDWVDGKIGEDGKEKKTRTCSVCNHVEDKIIDYKVDEEGWISAFKAARNFTIVCKEGDSEDFEEEYTMKLDGGLMLYYSIYSTSSYDSDTDTYITTRKITPTITEIIEEPGVSGTMTNYTYDSELDIWSIDYESTMSYEDLKEIGFESYIDAFYEYEIHSDWFRNYSKFTFNEETGTYHCDSLPVALIGFSDVLSNVNISFMDGKLTGISYEEGNNRYTATDFGTTKIDESFRNKIHRHTYDESTWSSDEDGHWHPANCEHKDKLSKYRFGYGSHDFSNGVCSVCGYKCTHPNYYINEEEDGFECYRCGYEHVHDDVTNEGYVAYDENGWGHGKICPSCGKFVQSTLVGHYYEDCVCKQCGFVDHNFEYDYSSDSQYHWHEVACSHKDIENTTKEEHDFAMFDDVCSICHYLNNIASSDDGEEVDENTWKKNFEAIELNNLTILSFRESEYGTSKMKFDGIYEELFNRSRTSWSDITHELYSFDDEKNYCYYDAEDGSYERREMLDGESIHSAGNVSYQRGTIEKLQEIPYSDFEFDSTLGMYKLSESSEHSSDFDDVYVKFVNRSLVYIGDIFRYSEFTVFYDFGTTEIEAPKVSKTYIATDKFVDLSYNDSDHYFVFDCEGEKKTFYDVSKPHRYELNENYDSVCVDCGHVCNHMYCFPFGEWYNDDIYCVYCNQPHLHKINDGECSTCGQSDAKKMELENKVVLNMFYYDLNSLTYTEHYEEGGSSSSSTIYAMGDKVKIVSEESTEYYVKEGDESWTRYYLADGKENEWVKKSSHKIEEFDDGSGLFYYSFYTYLENLFFSKGEGTFTQDSENENVYTYNSVDGCYEETITIEFLPSGAAQSIKIIIIEYQYDDDGNKVVKGQAVYETTAINETSFDLPDFGIAD